jgi:gamma-glutamyltranspeptidase/glutathione hydrolase
MRRLLVPALALGLLAPVAAAVPDAAATRSEPPRHPTAVGRHGAVASVDPYATRAGLRVLRHGGNAVDAAIATASALGVTEPFSSGIGGGGFFMYYDAKTGKTHTIDGREVAPGAMPRDAFIDPETGDPYRFTPELVTSGVSVGVPGTLATWKKALGKWGTRSLAQSLAPGRKIARRGFTVDSTFRQQVLDNKLRFNAFRPTRRLYLPHGHAPKVGSTFTNPDLAATYALIQHKGAAPLYRGRLGHEVVDAVRRPPTRPQTKLPVPRGFMKMSDLRRYEVRNRPATTSDYRGYTVHGMRGSSSGGTTVGETLNILERYDLGSMTDVEVQHLFIEAASFAFADRAKYVGDEAFVDVPFRDLLSDQYAAERACGISTTQASDKPVPPGDVTDYDGQCDTPSARDSVTATREGPNTTNLTVTDRRGNIVEYTLTIEQTGGSGIVVPDRGFLLNNELTDFNPVWKKDDPNRIQPFKRPRSSMSPTVVLDAQGEPFLALGSPGGSTIITTVLQILVQRIDRDRTIDQAIAAPRVAASNVTPVLAEQAYLDTYGAALQAYGHDLAVSPEIGAATAIEFGPGPLLTAAAEPVRRGGGAASVVDPVPTP